jgi:hypothetical protein
MGIGLARDRPSPDQSSATVTSGTGKVVADPLSASLSRPGPIHWNRRAVDVVGANIAQPHGQSADLVR